MKPLVLLALGILAAGCGPSLGLVTPAPPNRVVSLDREDDHIELSEGVAVAVACYRVGRPCTDVRASITDTRVARSYPAHVSKLAHRYVGETNVSSVALVGLSPGRTTLRVWSEGYTNEYTVTVVPAPPTAP